jgi:hypothetical protein
MDRLTIIITVAVAVLLITILSCGCISVPPAINNTTSTTLPTDATLRPNIASPDTLAASGHVYTDSKPVAGISVVAVSADGSDSLLAMTDRNGSYVLNIKPDVQYNATAYYSGLKRTIFPVYLHIRVEAGRDETVLIDMDALRSM